MKAQKLTHVVDKLAESVAPVVRDAIGGRRGRESSKRYNGRWLLPGEPIPSGWRDTAFEAVAISQAVIAYNDLVEQGGSLGTAKELLFKRVCKEYWRAGRRSRVFDLSWLDPIRSTLQDTRFITECFEMAEKKFIEGRRYRSVIEKERRAMARGGMMPRSTQEIILALGDFSKLPGIARVWASGARSLEMTAKQLSSLIARLGYGTAYKEISTGSRAILATIDDPDLLASLKRLADGVAQYRTPEPLGDGARRRAEPFDARVIGRALTALGIPSIKRNGINVYTISALSYHRARKIFREQNPIPRRKYQLREGLLPDLIEAVGRAPGHLAAMITTHLREMIRVGRYVNRYDFIVDKPPRLTPI